MISIAPPNGGSRAAIIALCNFTLRFMHNWRVMLDELSGDETDAETTLVMVSIVAIGAEKFTRGGLVGDLKDLVTAMPPGRLAKCNLSSIAAATGLNREKVRRKVDRLLRQGMLEKEPNGAIRVRAEVAAQPEVQQLIVAQNEAFKHFRKQMDAFARPPFSLT